MHIVSIFSGRRANLDVLCLYLKKALELCIIDEVHFWNNTRCAEDDAYLKTISNLKRTSSAGNGSYIEMTPEITDNAFELSVRASNDIHIKLSDTKTEYEIVLGGWGNTMSIIRENDVDICTLAKPDVADRNQQSTFQVAIHNDILSVSKNNERMMSVNVQPNFEIKHTYFKTGFGAVGDISYTTTQNKGFYLMDTCEKSWRNYYNYYDDPRFTNDIIVKCDDDIVFMDIPKFSKFIDFAKNDERYDVVFANTINNGVSAYFQQNKYDLIPKELMELEYPDGGFCGSLWESGEKAERLHEYFIKQYAKFLDHEYNNDIIPIDTRFSINFFAYKGKNWHKIRDSFADDEYNLTVDYVKNRGFKNVLYSDFYVSHLSFYKQVETGIHLSALVDKYTKLYSTMEERWRKNESVPNLQ
jgi:hypothetical protein